jgi:hypothetical protein
MNKPLMLWRQAFERRDIKCFLNAGFVWRARGVTLLVEVASTGLAARNWEMSGWVDRPVDWPYSSIHRDMARGLLPATWGPAESSADMDLE